MAKILQAFNEATTRAISEANIDVRMTSFDTEFKEMVYKTAASTFYHFPSLEELAIDGAADVGLNSTLFSETDVKDALEGLKNLITNTSSTATLQNSYDNGTGVISVLNLAKRLTFKGYTDDTDIVLEIQNSSSVAGLQVLGGGALTIKEQSAPGTPSSGYGTLYPKAGGDLYWKNDAGTEFNLVNSSLSGSGTAGMVARWTGTSALGTGALYDDGTNVGIGTTSPLATLNPLSTTEQLRLSYDVSNYVSFTTVSTGNMTVFPTGGKVLFGSALNIGANIAIATESDSSNIVIDTGGANVGLSIISAGATGTGNISFGDVIDANIGKISYLHNGNSMVFTAGAATALTLTSTLSYFAESLGIGTATPLGATPSGWISGGRAIQVSSTSGANGAGIFLRRSDDATGLDLWEDGGNGIAYIDSRFNDAASITKIRVRTNGAPVDAITILGSGNVGIGTTSPLAKLNPQSTTEQLRTSYSAAVYTSFITDSGGTLTIDPTGEYMVLDGNMKAGDNILIAPDADARNIVIDKGEATAGITIMSTSAGSIMWGDAADADAAVVGFSHSSNTLSFTVGGAGPSLTINSAGAEATQDFIVIDDLTVSDGDITASAGDITALAGLINGLTLKAGTASSVTPATAFDAIVIDEGSLNTGMTILASNLSVIQFGSLVDSELGSIRYSVSGDEISLVSNAGTALAVNLNTVTAAGSINATDGHIISIAGQIAGGSTTSTPGGTTETVDWDNGNVHVIHMGSATGDVTLTINNPNTNGSGTYFIKAYDESSGYNLIFPSSVKTPNGNAPTLSAGATVHDLFTLVWDTETDTYSLTQTQALA